MVWLPLERAVAVKAATPFTKACVPSAAVPSMKVTIPVGVPIAGAVVVTLAVKETDWPGIDGLGLEERPTIVLPLVTPCVRVELAAAKLALPE
jgi:hypothetical protein